MFRDGVAETTIDVSPAARAISSSSSDSRPTDASTPEAVADVEKDELRDTGPQVRQDAADAHEPLPANAPHRGTATHPLLEHVPERRDRVLAIALGAHGGELQSPRRARADAVLDVDGVDALGPVDLATRASSSAASVR